jgi:hypothetical protein
MLPVPQQNLSIQFAHLQIELLQMLAKSSQKPPEQTG